MADLKIGRIMMGMVQTNCYFIYRDGESDAIVVDPAEHGDLIFQKLTDKGFVTKAILLTHGHFDHILGVEKLKELSQAPVYAPEAERIVLESIENNCSGQVRRPCIVKADHFLTDLEMTTIGSISFQTILTPGHTIGSSCYYFEEAGILISGDTLFLESVGRTDLPTGSGATLGRSIKNKLACLPGTTKVYPGHGDSTTIAHEIKYNPFIG
ncbi:MAG: MBL fold metallo-hydrolase [Clostridiales bacterium]|nr:MBL fold metallo-hydrolase [Clostridiales bacterium]